METKVKKSRRVIRQHEFVLKKEHKEKATTLPSMTVPDESYTIKELFERFSKGQSTGAPLREGIYNLDDKSVDFDSPDLEKVKSMDLVDQSEIADQQAQRTRNLKTKYDDDQKRRSQKQKEEDELSSQIKQDFLKRKKDAAAGADDSGRNPGKGGKE